MEMGPGRRQVSVLQGSVPTPVLKPEEGRANGGPGAVNRRVRVEPATAAVYSGAQGLVKTCVVPKIK